MKRELLMVKELAAELRMSVKSIQRAYRKGEIPVQWLGPYGAFRCRNQVRLAMERNGRNRVQLLNDNSAHGRARRAAMPAARRRKRPRLVTRGHYPQGSLQEV